MRRFKRGTKRVCYSVGSPEDVTLEGELEFESGVVWTRVDRREI
jgi:hypothetical protein